MHPALLLLTDSRLPAGGHAHSGGTERAVASGAVHDVPSLRSFLRGRLHTAGTLASALTAAACTEAARLGTSRTEAPRAGTSHAGTSPAEAARPGQATRGEAARIAARTATTEAAGAAVHAPSVAHVPAPLTAPRRRDEVRRSPAHLNGAQPTNTPDPWVLLDTEVDARTASPAQRDASRTQGRLLLRVARRIWPSPILDDLATTIPSPHHPIALGATAHAAGATPEEAALAAAYHAVTGPATAAVRLLGLDPVAVHALLADLTPDLTAVAAQACLAAPGWEALPAYSSPALDLLAEQHAQATVRLFIS
ncbi:urease accessory protein [Nonomuraea sp. PA05]|uniref:urease accessory protein UreF n=1 Tax=Nonomuraea sp. PA05 TaxID=2604466 RepID=UPI0011D48910|nr:urease accessory UreF family protein [Nonomuraea sp. PA05]TYB58556.1 urease accessory protein [Nonomuraea sp. PA05]